MLDETECNRYAVHMSNLASLQSKYACLIDELDEAKSRLSLFGACKSCPALQSELAKETSRNTVLEKVRCNSSSADCALCQSSIQEVEAGTVDGENVVLSHTQSNVNILRIKGR